MANMSHQIIRKSIILKKNDIPIEAGNLATAFDPYVYDQTQFISDLCDVMWQENDTDVLLAEILHKELNLSNQQTRTMIYELLLYKCVDKHELNNSNFIKILQTTARGLYPNIDCDAIATISHNEKLTGKLFIKGDPQFKNSLKFGKMFKSIDNWNKKQWANIYITMNKWQSSHTALTTAAPISSSSSVSNQQLDSTVMIEDIDKGTDLQHIQEFCAITRSTENVAIHFLKESEWNVTFAVNRYYATNCDDAIPQNNMNDNHEDSTRVLYDHGIPFWYWETRKAHKRYVEPKFNDLKQEILHFKHFTIKQWQCLVNECTILTKSDHIKTVSSNGNHADIYKIQKDDPITMDHVYSIKLYTDYSWLCTIFCQAFRLKR
eukprot:96478_1